MSLAQRVGQLLMVGSDATVAEAATRDAISRYHVGNVMLTGRSSRGVAATARVSAALAARATTSATAGVPLLVATDQEGGKVQVLSGNGFSRIPSGLTQGGWSSQTLRSRTAAWAGQLRAAGVRLDLAPVADTVPSSMTSSNLPIGSYDRELGHDSGAVADHVVAFTEGMLSQGVATAAKHFPGLGRVHGNTDTTAGVTDTATTRTSSYLEPFRRAIRAGTPFVMVSSAYYSRLDPAHPACFSRTVVTDLLRGDLGFSGVVISDDLGKAAQVARWSFGSRAVQFVAAGGDLVLTVEPGPAAAMYGALYHRAQDDGAFRDLVDAAALRVLRAKASLGLLR
jgi:beta-N-acetylhexosaminidase